MASSPALRQLALAVTIAIGLVTGACTIKNDLYCCSSAASCDEGGTTVTACTDPDRPYCDDTGEYGPGRTCIADPGATDCAGPNDCMNVDRPFCLDMVCVQCEEDGDCDAATPVCGAAHLCGPCENDNACEARDEAPRCFVDDGACVACLDSADDCTSADAPVCDDATHECRGCAADDECPSDVCDESAGTCIAEADVIYLAPTGGAGTCAQAAPCNTFALGIAQVAGTRTVIKAAAGTYMGPIVVNAITVTILADGATAQPTATESVVAVTSGGSATIEGLTVTAVIGTGTTHAVSCNGSTLVLRRASIVGNNGGGGVLLDNCQFSLVNNVIASNGSGANSQFGGVRVTSIGTPGMHELEFNTVTNNSGITNAITGVECASVLTPLVFSNNIVYANPVTGTGTQVGGDVDCTWTYSDVGPQTVSGTGNTNMDPMFVNIATRDFHLMASSPVENLADDAATNPVDLDGDARPQGGRSDMGADEIVP